MTTRPEYLTAHDHIFLLSDPDHITDSHSMQKYEMNRILIHDSLGMKEVILPEGALPGTQVGIGFIPAGGSGIIRRSLDAPILDMNMDEVDVLALTTLGGFLRFIKLDQGVYTTGTQHVWGIVYSHVDLRN